MKRKYTVKIIYKFRNITLMLNDEDEKGIKKNYTVTI